MTGHRILLGGISSWYSEIGPLDQDSSDYVSEAQLDDVSQSDGRSGRQDLSILFGNNHIEDQQTHCNYTTNKSP